MGGWLMGFPFVSAPISLILAMQNGPAFAGKAALGTLGGLASVCAYCLVYALAAQWADWPAALAAAIGAFLAVTWAWNTAGPGLLLTLAIDAAALAAALWLRPRPNTRRAPAGSPWWDLPARVVLATGFVLALTTASGRLGPALAGLLAPFPVFSSVIAPFTQQQEGPAAAMQLMGGILLGMFAFGCFYALVAALLPAAPLGWTYAGATAAALGVHALALRVMRKN